MWAILFLSCQIFDTGFTVPSTIVSDRGLILCFSVNIHVQLLLSAAFRA